MIYNGIYVMIYTIVSPVFASFELTRTTISIGRWNFLKWFPDQMLRKQVCVTCGKTGGLLTVRVAAPVPLEHLDPAVRRCRLNTSG